MNKTQAIAAARPRRDNNEHAIARGYVGRKTARQGFDLHLWSARVCLHNYRSGANCSWLDLNRAMAQLRIALYLHQLMKAEAANVAPA